MYNMKRTLLILCTIIVLGILFYLYRKHSIEQEQRYLFSLELIESLKYCHESIIEGRYGEDRIKALESVYSGKEKLFKAKEIMENWKQNSNEDIRKVSSDFLKGLDGLIFTNNFIEKLVKGTVGDYESEFALSKVKIDEGRRKIFESSIGLTTIITSNKGAETEDKPIRFNLSKQQLDHIVQYINDNFEEELKDIEKKKNEKIKDFELPLGIWAAVLIKGFIEKNR